VAEAQGILDAAELGIGIPVPNPVYALKGSGNENRGMKDRRSRIFDSETGVERIDQGRRRLTLAVLSSRPRTREL
jgi:hypothetical protein